MLDTLTGDINKVTLDDPIIRAGAEEQSGTFFKDNPPPVFVDEIQKAPALFEQIKLLLDRDRQKGQFWMERHFPPVPAQRDRHPDRRRQQRLPAGRKPFELPDATPIAA